MIYITSKSSLQQSTAVVHLDTPQLCRRYTLMRKHAGWRDVSQPDLSFMAVSIATNPLVSGTATQMLLIPTHSFLPNSVSVPLIMVIKQNSCMRVTLTINEVATGHVLLLQWPGEHRLKLQPAVHMATDEACNQLVWRSRESNWFSHDLSHSSDEIQFSNCGQIQQKESEGWQKTRLEKGAGVCLVSYRLVKHFPLQVIPLLKLTI